MLIELSVLVACFTFWHFLGSVLVVEQHCEGVESNIMSGNYFAW